MTAPRAGRPSKVLITGGAGYVGSALVPALLAAGHEVAVLDLYLFGEDALKDVRGHPRLVEFRGDVRDRPLLGAALRGRDAVIHLACISNDPSFELDPGLGKSINYDTFRPLVRAAKDAGVGRFVYASTSSVYGIKDGVEVTEDLPLEPLTDYSRYKAMCEDVLLAEREPGFAALILRPATVCGYAPRQRLDVVVNILTNHAVNAGSVQVFGGSQLRPNIHIADMVDVYLLCLDRPAGDIDGRVYNVGYENLSLLELAERVRKVVGGHVRVEVKPTADARSYHVSSERIRRDLGFKAVRTVEDAVRDLAAAFRAGKLPDPFDDPRYYNVRTIREAGLS
jgi:nucleoside-diphosphate-sugar epimerase